MSNKWLAVLFLVSLALMGNAEPEEEDEPVVVRVKQGVMQGSAGV